MQVEKKSKSKISECCVGRNKTSNSKHSESTVDWENKFNNCQHLPLFLLGPSPDDDEAWKKKKTLTMNRHLRGRSQVSRRKVRGGSGFESSSKFREFVVDCFKSDMHSKRCAAEECGDKDCNWNSGSGKANKYNTKSGEEKREY